MYITELNISMQVVLPLHHLTVQRLKNVGALYLDDSLTPLGYHLAQLPVDVRIGKLMLYGCMFRCLDAALTIAACLSFKSPFVSPFKERESANEARNLAALVV